MEYAVRPKHHQSDKKIQDKWLQELPKKIGIISQQVILKNKKIAVYFEDETRYGQISLTRKIWETTGVRSTFQFSHGFLNKWIYGAVNSLNGEHFELILPRLDSENMQIFLDEFSKTLPSEIHAIIILDGSRAHKNNILKIPENISTIILPPYSPELNPIERLWQWIKRNHLSFKIFKNAEDIIDAGVHAVKKITKEIVRSIL